jgi:hypothetical protein
MWKQRDEELLDTCLDSEQASGGLAVDGQNSRAEGVVMEGAVAKVDPLCPVPVDGNNSRAEGAVMEQAVGSEGRSAASSILTSI